MRIIYSILVLFLIGCSSKSAMDNYDSKEWWMFHGSTKSCIKSVGEHSWAKPKDLLDNYNCEISKDMGILLAISCDSGELEGGGYLFSWDKEACEIYEKKYHETKEDQI